MTDPLKNTAPVEPKPSDFGLTEERARQLTDPASHLVANRWTWMGLISVIAVIVYVLITYGRTEWLMVVLLSPILWMLIILFLGIPAMMIVSAVWRRVQPDFPKYQAYDRARAQFRNALAEWKRTQQEWWQSLRGKALEAEVARSFAQRGFAVRHVGGAGDEGVDLLLTSGERTILVQCKGHKKPIGPAVVREVYGSLAHHKHGEAWLVAPCGFTRAAIDFARGKPIRLLGVENLIAELQRADL